MVRLRLGKRTRCAVPVESVELIVRDLQSAVDQARLNKIERLKERRMPRGPVFKAKMRHDLNDAYGETYYAKGEVVEVERREMKPGEAESVLAFPFRIGGFNVTAAAFDPIK